MFVVVVFNGKGAQPVDAVAVHGVDGEGPAGDVDAVTGVGDAAQHVQDQSGGGVVVAIAVQVQAQPFGELVDVGAAVDQPTAVVLAHHHGGDRFVLVGHLAGDGFHHVGRGRQSN